MKEQRRGAPVPPGGRSNLEQIFGFEDPEFRRYILMENTSRISPSALLALSSEMSKSNHPIVRYAAGWAAAEAALYRVKPRPNRLRDPYPLEPRLNALETARSIWFDLIDVFGAACNTATSPQRQADFLAFQVLSAQAVAYLPSMQLAAKLFSGSEVSVQDMAEKLIETKERVVTVGSYVVGLEGRGQDFLDSRSGLNNEILAGLLVQNDPLLRYIVVPASVRHDHNRAGNRRADMAAISTGTSHPKTLIQVTSRMGANMENVMRFIIRPRDDLVLHGCTPRDTLRAFLNGERSEEFNELSRLIVDRLAEFSSQKGSGR